MSDIVINVKPRFSPGDMVEVDRNCSDSEHGVVIAVSRANSIPDAEKRGIIDSQTWSYYVLFADERDVHGVMGPFMSDEMHGV